MSEFYDQREAYLKDVFVQVLVEKTEERLKEIQGKLLLPKDLRGKDAPEILQKALNITAKEILPDARYYNKPIPELNSFHDEMVTDRLRGYSVDVRFDYTRPPDGIYRDSFHPERIADQIYVYFDGYYGGSGFDKFREQIKAYIPKEDIQRLQGLCSRENIATKMLEKLKKGTEKSHEKLERVNAKEVETPLNEQKTQKDLKNR